VTRLIASVVAMLVTMLIARPAWAHAAPHSIVLLDLRANDIGAELRLPVPELEAALGRPLLAEGATVVDRERDMLRALVARDLHVASPDGAAWRVDVGDLGYAVDDQVPVVVASATLTPPPGRAPRVFTMVDDVIGKDVPNHSTWIGVRSDFAGGLVSGSPTLVGVTHYLHHTVLVDRRGEGVMPGFRAVLHLGMRHIAEGTDHLLFLLVLLLPAPLLLARGPGGRARWGAPAGVRASCAKLLRVVTAFTVGHSLTLLVGTAGWLRLPSCPVETLIATSILVTAVHALRPMFPGREAWVAGGFGLVHGLAFAGALAELHLDPARLALALLGFNLGIEAMQLAVVAASFPWLLLLARTRLYAPLRRGGAVFAGVAALGWIVERALHLPNPVEDVVGAIAAHPLVLLASLAGIAVAARVGDGLACELATASTDPRGQGASEMRHSRS
jgi:hypothetical protein